LKKKPTLEDLNVWTKFIFSKKPIKDKDVYLDQNKPGQFLTKKIDLHGYTLDEANLKTKELILSYYKQNIYKVIIITGKGSKSDNEKNPYISKDLSLLKYSVPHYLKTNESLKQVIKNISQADIKDGGEGAFYVYLKKFKE
jgi:DNA-nicking Smr family endonuclease|tara:strand:+ start:631 stop:1053 length:423 start_codon:yes stop_codon:yes gene_type:complete